jgi:hypothetical protein
VGSGRSARNLERRGKWSPAVKDKHREITGGGLGTSGNPTAEKKGLAFWGGLLAPIRFTLLVARLSLSSCVPR